MKFLGVVGSPRKNGNSDILMQEAAEGAKEKGASVTIFHVNEMEIRGCQGCFCCKDEGACVQDDDMKELFDAISDADAVVFASPVYFGTMPGQLKLVTDRFYSYLRRDFGTRLPVGKKLGLIFCQGSPDPEMFSQNLKSIEFMLKRIGFRTEEGQIITAAGCGAAGSVREHPELLKSARSMGRQLATRTELN